MQLEMLYSIIYFVLFSDLILKANDHYGNVIRVEKFQSDMAIKAFSPGHISTEWFEENGDIRTVNAFYSLVFIALQLAN